MTLAPGDRIHVRMGARSYDATVLYQSKVYPWCHVVRADDGRVLVADTTNHAELIESKTPQQLRLFEAA